VGAIGLESRPRLYLPAVLGLLAAALVARVMAVGMDGHVGDVIVIHRWAETLAQVGPAGFYATDTSVYPALLYLLWPLGVALDGETLDLAIKGASIPFDLAVGAVLLVVGSRLAGAWTGLAAAAIYLLNPAVLAAGPMWGQLDAAGTLCFLLALLATAQRRYAAAGALAALAGLVKPQFGLVALPVAVLVLRDRGWRPLLAATAAGLAAYLAVTLPLRLDPIRLLDAVREVTDSKPNVSVSAPNPWALLVGYGVPDDGFAPIGAVLLVAGLALAVTPLLRGSRRADTWTVLAVGTFVVFAFYFLPTRVHERYLFPAFALLAPAAAVSRASLAALAVMSLAFTASLFASLSISQSGTVGSWPIAEALRSAPSVWLQGLALVGAALVEVRLALRQSGRAGTDAG
jgi:hypothetical protein